MTSPSPFVLEHLGLAPPGPALDVAAGRGRHSLAIARTGRPVEAIDRDPAACAALLTAARAARLTVRVVCADLERFPLPVARYALVVDTLYLERGLMPSLRRSLRPGGLLVLETFTREQLRTGHPRNPAFMLEPGEILRLTEGLEVIGLREGAAWRDGRMLHLAAVAARAPAP